MARATCEADAMTAGFTTHSVLPPTSTCLRMLDLMKKVRQPRLSGTRSETVSLR